MLLLAAVASAATPAENAFLKWADKCPATALGAGLYAGADHVTVTLGERTLHRLRVVDEGPSPASPRTESLWMAAEGCRAIGYVEQGPKLGIEPRAAGFVVAKGGAPPTEAERALLLTWAGHTPWSADRPEHAVATARFDVGPVGMLPVEELPGARLVRVPGYDWRPGEPPTQLGAWRPADAGPDGASCPCFEVVHPGEPARSELLGRTRLTFGGEAGRIVGLVVDPAGPRWAVAPAVDVGSDPLPGAPPVALADLVVTTRPRARGPILVVRDPATGNAALLDARGLGPFAFTPTGIALGDGRELPAATVAAWVR